MQTKHVTPDIANLSRTAHAEQRLQERKLPDWQIEFALRWGTRLHRRGATVFHVRRKDLPAWLDERNARRFYGTTVVVAGGALVTAYLKPGGFHDLKRTPRRPANELGGMSGDRKDAWLGKVQ